MNADAGIRRARSACHKANARAAREFAVGLRHIGCTAFLAADNESDVLAGFIKCIEHREITLTGNAERHVHTVHLQRINEQLTAAAAK
jgi:hypothetical protein